VINKHILGYGYAIEVVNRTEFRSAADGLEEKSVAVQIRIERHQNGGSLKQ
jgi:hypothetical protein